MTLKRANAGDPLEIPATTWNSLIDSAEAVQRINPTIRRTRQSPPRDDTVLVRNSSGVGLNRFSVLALDGPIIDPDDNADEFARRIAFDGIAVANAGAVIAVLQEPLAADAIGRAHIVGLTHALVDVSSSAHRYAIPAVGEVKLASADRGPHRIIWKDSTATGELLAIVELRASESGIYKGTITAVTGATNATYDAEADIDPSISVSEAAPMDRPASTSLATYTAKSIGNPCELMVHNGTVLLWSAREVMVGRNCTEPS